MSVNHAPTSASLSGLVARDSEMVNNAEEIPFLVTHWLANYKSKATEGEEGPEHEQAMQRIRKATSEIASAFSSLGAYGTSYQPSFGSSSFLQQVKPRNATYTDLNRRWPGLPSSHLENIAQTVATNNVVVGNATANSSHINLLHASGESTQLREGRTLEGRTLQDAIQIDGSNSQVSQTVSGISILQSPVWITCQQKAMDSKKMEMTDAERSSSPNPTIEIKSRYSDVAKCTSDYMHELLKLREKTKSVLHEIKALQTAIEKQEENREELILRFQRISVDISLSPANKLQHLDAIKAERLVSDRVITQLKRKATELTSIQEKDAQELLLLESQSKVWEGKRRSFLQKFRDPFEPKGMGRNRLLQTLLGRQQGNIMSRPTLQPSIQSHLSATRKNLIYSRLSHAATINSHLTYPVYCLRFDRTGRYFITGADDYLIKVFYLGAGISCRNKNQSDGSRELRCNYGANLRGAVLVCSLRGHAGVINDIDVSADNCFLATASVDGDVRVWGLKDGCPVAVLRGHKGGANMVSWSTLTPYRLVSTGSDGYARQWDIREACLKRYGKIVGKREEYRLRLTTREQVVDDAERKNNHISHAPSENLLPPLPVREGAVVNAAALAPGRSQNIIAASPDRVVVPALPAGVPPLPGQNLAAAASQNGDGSINQAPGQFVANDLLDEGVKLLGRFKHGATGEDNAGPGTRSRRTAVKVICVARSPIGGHFTTGSDDGICRVWPDSEESKVEVVDRRKLENIFMQRKPLARKRTTRSVDDPLLQLMGHVSAITDLSYSSSGDRLLSASQKEGVIRIWSLSDKFAELTSNGTRIDERGIGQIVIRLTNPSASNQSQKSSRRRPGHSSQTETSKVNCDVAVWSHDDSRILTSQSVLLKQNGTDVQPGSQFLFLWDSLTGQCLMGISGAHAMQCPVVIPHPADSSLVCTAGADGYAKVWDWESGRCVFTHQNKVEFGPSSDVSDRNKVAGYLDGAFSPDGTTVVLTDDDGRITVLDCESSKTLSSTESPAWMQEQYFANDYYELFYDRYGYCIERGSERPPHLAPRGVHCNHSGSPWSDEIDEAFARGRLVGPMPLPEHTCRWRRKQIREKSGLIMQSKAASLGTRSGSGPMMIRRGIREFDALTTIMIQGSGHDDKLFELEATASGNQDGIDRQVAATENENGRAASSRNLSNNWQWRDFDDLIRDQGNPEEEEDLEDEEFEPTARRSSGRRLNGNEDDDENMDEDDSDEELDFEEDENFESPSRSTRRSREAASSGRRQRSQRRAAQRNERFVELGSEDEGLVEFMSLNNTPSGPYIRDYNMTGHFWRLSGSRRVKRGWLSRMESDTSYEGRKTYTPQLGDSIVYIPRAHYETLQEYPSLSPPWQRWPQSAAWPVVRCVVRGMRFRFPYEDYYRKGRIPCNSIVAILTLEVTGIPELSKDRDFPWPKPTFIEPTRQYVFELSLFDTNVEFVFPEAQYVGRLEALERAARAQSGMNLNGLEVTVNYSQEGDDREFQAYPAKLEGVGDEEAYHHDANLRGSGFGTLAAICQGYSEIISPWELLTAQTPKPNRPSLSEEEKKDIINNIKIQLRKSDVNEYFSREVDQGRYSDYWSMVEIEMFLLLVKRRLEENYYGSKLSVVGDVRLIKDNCIKYNDIQNDLSAIATEMCTEFERSVLSSEELSQLITEEDFTRLADVSSQTPERMNLRVRVPRNNDEGAASRTADDQAYGLRGRARRQTSLERLAQPDNASSRRRGLRNEFDAALPRRRNSRTRSRDPTPETETLGRVSRRLTSARPNYGDNSTSSDSIKDGNSESEDERKPASRSRSKRVPQDIDESVGEVGFRSTRRRTSRIRYDDEEEEEDDEIAFVGRPSRSSRSAASRRTKARTQISSSGAEDDAESEESAAEFESEASDFPSEVDDSDDEEEEVIKSSRKRSRSVAGKRQPLISPLRSRRKMNVKASYEDVDSDIDMEEESFEEEEEEEAETVSNSRTRARRAASYKVPSSDDEDDDEESFADTRISERQLSKQRQVSRKRKSNNDSTSEFPHLNEWPEIYLKDISSVARDVLQELLKLDRDECFAIPVLETYPDIKCDYLKVVKTPMDLRTIEEERVQQYQHIKELQQDLNTMFENCYNFNGAGTDLSDYSIKIWKQTNETFVKACKRLDVLLPRRWSP